jgi:hypothetical protein
MLTIIAGDGDSPTPKEKRSPCDGLRSRNALGFGNNNGTPVSTPVASEQHADAIRRLRRQRHVERIHRLPARVTAELLDELDRRHRLGTDLDRRLARYAALDPVVLASVGGDRFPASPIHVAGGEQ